MRQATASPELPPEAREYLRQIGLRGAAVHSLDDSARRLGVAVRKVKRAYLRKGFSPAAALEKARARLHLDPRRQK